MALVGAVLAFAWPVVQDGISIIANLVRDAGSIGTFLYGLIERALIPFGLHHVFYTPFWFGSLLKVSFSKWICCKLLLVLILLTSFNYQA